MRAAGTAREDAADVMNTVADRLTDHGLDILGPAWGEAHCFRVPNVRGALCEVTVREDGTLAWEYRPFHGYRADPARITAIAAEVLGAGSVASGAAGRAAGLTLKGAVGVALREAGLAARLGPVVPDESACEVYAEVEISNPGRAERGTVWVSDEGMIRWECQVGPPGGGVEAAEAAETIARALSL
jgi:hypothetical protein